MTARVASLLLLTLVLTACSGATTTRSTTAPSAPAPASTADPAPSATATAGEPRTTHGELQPSEGFARTEVAFVDGPDRVAVPVLVADTRELRTTGLMGRTDLPDDAGMVFVFEEVSQGAFWMKDTLVPLTIAYVGDDGTVQQLTDMDPCTADPCPSYPADEPYRYAVEANQGFYARHGITPGWTLELPDAIGRTS